MLVPFSGEAYFFLVSQQRGGYKDTDLFRLLQHSKYIHLGNLFVRPILQQRSQREKNPTNSNNDDPHLLLLQNNIPHNPLFLHPRIPPRRRLRPRRRPPPLPKPIHPPLKPHPPTGRRHNPRDPRLRSPKRTLRAPFRRPGRAM